MNAKLWGMAVVVVGCLTGAGSVLADQPSQAGTEDIPLLTVLAPDVGFDTNDNVQVVAYGKLPSACYHLGQATAEATADPHIFNVYQYAARDTSGTCQEGVTPTAAQAIQAPFTSEISLGQLTTGTYRFNYTQLGPSGTLVAASTSLTVATAAAPTVGDIPFAPTSSIAVPDVINGSDHIVTTISGVLITSCMKLNPTVQVVPELNVNVYVLGPTVTTTPHEICANIVTPFSKTVDLGPAGKPGYYLVQVRSMNGRAVNHVIQVMK